MYKFGHLLVGLLLIGCTIQYVSSRVPLSPRYFQNSDSGSENEKSYRLPGTTIPKEYDVTISTKVDEKKSTFYGVVVIKIVAVTDTSEIVLHSRQQTNIKAELAAADGTVVQLNGDPSYEIDTEFLKIQTTTPLKKDAEYKLTIKYQSELRQDRAGFYQAKYKSGRNEIWFAATQFESTDARHAFPCYDEPALKAKFTIHIQHSNKYSAISNMPVSGTKDVDSKTNITDFEQTPLMSTYLVAFFVSDFTYIEEKSGNNNPITQRVYTSKNKIGQAPYALKEGVSILNTIANYLGVPFAISKMDQVAIPNEHFNAGAMENWGLVTYRDAYLLYDEANHLTSRQFDVSTVISHEFGHQWFGNLVSPKWWSYIWLNEGFATLFEYLGAGLVHSDWNIFNYFAVNEVQPALQYDAQLTTRAMTTNAEKPTEIAALFDRIAYAKSGSVLRQFMHALGEETFKKGLQYYLKEYQYKDADDMALFSSLAKAAVEDKLTVDVPKAFSSWSNQKGFPLLSVTRNADGTLTLKQEKYNKDSTESPVWYIPYNFVSAKKPEFTNTKAFAWMNETEQIVSPSDATAQWSNDDWLLFNVQQTGFYRVSYDDHSYDLINNALKSNDFSKIHEINRASYIDDLSDLVKSGRHDPLKIFKALNYLKRENAYAPWVSARRAILQLKQALVVSEKLGDYKTFIAQSVEPLYKAKGLEAAEGTTEGLFDKLTRNIAINLACGFGLQQCLDETKEKLVAFLESDVSAPTWHQDVRGHIFANGIRSIDRGQFLNLYDYLILNTDESDDERKEIIASFANTEDDEIISHILNSITFDESSTHKYTNAAERLKIIQNIIGGSQNGVKLTLNHVLAFFDDVKLYIGSIKVILKSIAANIATTELESEFDNLLNMAIEKKECTEDEVKAFKETVAQKIEWMKNRKQSYENGLANKDDKVTPPPPLTPPKSNTVLIVIVVLLVGGVVLLAAVYFIRRKRNNQTE